VNHRSKPLRDYHECPGREVIATNRDGTTTARCRALSDVLGWTHNVDESICRQCAIEGPADAGAEYFRKHRIPALLKTRVTPPLAPGCPPSATPEAAFTKLVKEGYATTEEARELLRRVVGRGFDPTRAGDMADAAGVGDV